MSDLLSIGTSALLAYRKALDTAGHNIANVNTPGYTRQRVELSSRLGAPVGDGYIGAGVQSDTVRRLADLMVLARQQANASGLGSADMFSAIAGRVDQLMSSADSGLSKPLTDFFGALGTLANNPNSSAARQGVIAAGQTLTARFSSIQGQLDGMSGEIDQRVRASVDEINGYARSVAGLNQQIVLARGAAGGQPPNDLIDQRDQLIQQISSRIGVSTVAQADGSVNLYIGGGQALVLGREPHALGTSADPFNSGRLEVTFGSGSASTVISSQLGGGTLGGLMDVRREVLDPARDELGRIAAGLVQSFNAQHASGVDATGAAGGNFFAPLTGTALPATANAGTASIAVGFGDASQLTGHDYEMRYDGAAWHLYDSDAGSEVTLTGTGTSGNPFVGAGLSLVVGGSPNAGDRFAVQPTRNLAGSLSVAITDPARIAAASSTSGANSADNTNARALAGLATRAVLDGGRTTLTDANGALVAKTGSAAARATLTLDAQTAIAAQTDAERENISGVNLDEEAADMLRFQQAYQAAARIIQVADDMFQSLLAAAGR
jgi:flagellar hook-associated protein 1 FlgK